MKEEVFSMKVRTGREKGDEFVTQRIVKSYQKKYAD